MPYARYHCIFQRPAWRTEPPVWYLVWQAVNADNPRKRREDIVKKAQNDKLKQIEDGYRELLGMDDASLLREMEEAEREWEEEKAAHPEEDERQKQQADHDFEILMARIKAEEKEPVSIREYNRRKKWENQDGIGRRKGYKRLAIVAAVFGVLVIGGGISSVARNGYQYMVYLGQKSENIEIRFSTNIKFASDELDYVYNHISENLGIPTLMLYYMPDGMDFLGVKEMNNYVIMQFDYQNHYFYLRQEKLSDKNAVGLVVSDRNDYQNVWNDWLDKELELEENLLENGDIEYSVALEDDNAYYYICGIMRKEEFVKIVENLAYY